MRNRHPEGAPIGGYRHVPVEVHRADPGTPEVARRLIALIATRWPDTPAEHVGSSAVPGLAGKNIIDLLLAAEPAHIPAITQTLLELGSAWPTTSPAGFTRTTWTWAARTGWRHDPTPTAAVINQLTPQGA